MVDRVERKPEKKDMESHYFDKISGGVYIRRLGHRITPDHMVEGYGSGGSCMSEIGIIWEKIMGEKA